MSKHKKKFFNFSVKDSLFVLLVLLAGCLLLPVYEEFINRTVVALTGKYFQNSVGMSALYIVTILVAIYFICRKILDLSSHVIRWSYTYLLCGILSVWVYYRFFNKIWIFEGLFDSPLSYIDLLAVLLLSMVVCCFTVNLRIYRQRTHDLKKNNGTDATVDSTFSLIPDSSLRSVNEDSFSRNRFAETLSRKLMSLDVDKESFSLAITAPWGYGKTSFLFLLKNALKDKPAIVMEFSPWSLNPETSITKAFYLQLANCLGGINREIAKLIRKYLDILDGNISRRILGFVDDDSMDKLKNTISASLEELDQRVIVIIDDIDRLSSEEILEVLRIIRGSAVFSKMIFVSCFDKQYVKEALKDRSYAIREDFLEKFFQHELVLPKFNKKGLYDKAIDFAGKCFKESPEDLKEFKEYIDIHKSGFMASDSVMEYFHNPRHLLRWLNNLSLSYSVLKGECTIADLGDIELLKLLYPTIYRLISTSFKKYFIAENGYVKLWNESKSNKEHDWLPNTHSDLYASEEYLRLSAKEKESVKSILKRLTRSHGFDVEPFRFSSVGFSQRYFYGLLQKDEVSQKEFEYLISLSYEDMKREVDEKYLNRIDGLALLCHTVTPKASEQDRKIIQMVLYIASKVGSIGFSTIVFMERLERVNDNPNTSEDLLYDFLLHAPLSCWMSFVFNRHNTSAFPICLKSNPTRQFLSESFMDRVQKLCMKKALEEKETYDNVIEVYSNCSYNFKNNADLDENAIAIKKECDEMMKEYIIGHFSELFSKLYYKDKRYSASEKPHYGIAYPFNVLWHSWKDFLDEFKALDSSLYDKSKLDELGSLYDKCKESSDDSVEFDLKFLEAVD